MKTPSTCFLILALLLPAFTQAQTDPPPPLIDGAETAHYRDSVRMHEASILHYLPHRCINRHGKYGWVQKFHEVRIPFEYDQLPSLLTDFNLARKGKLEGALGADGQVLIPFTYTGIHPYRNQQIVICANGPNKKTVLNFKGNTIIPENNYLQIYLFNDTTIAVVRNPQDQQTLLYNLRGEYVKTWKYRYISELPSGRYRVSKDTLIGTSLLQVSGLLDPAGRPLIPMEYTDIGWERGDWAWVSNYKTRARGLYQISTQTLHPFSYYAIGAPDPRGNFTFSVGESSERTRTGLMDANFREIFPPVYRNIQWLDEKGHYILTANPGRRGYRCGIGNALGEIVVDTLLSGFKQTRFEKIPPTLNTAGYVEYDTLPYWTYEDGTTGKMGLWHRQLGTLRPPEYDRITPVSHTAYIALKEDTSMLYHADGRILAGPHTLYYPLSKSNRYLIAQSFSVNSKGSRVEILDMEGRHVKDLESEPRFLCDPIYTIKRYSDYGGKKQYALFDSDLNPITDFVFGQEPLPLETLPLKQRIRVLEMPHPDGFGPWIAYMKAEGDSTLILLDGTGQTFELK